MIKLRFFFRLVLFAGSLIQLSGCVAVIGAGIAAGASVANDRRAPGVYLDDERIESELHDKFYADEQLWRQTHLNATSINRIVLLTGEVPNEAHKNTIGQLTAGISKVRKVYNELVIADPSSMVSRSGDSWITSKVKSQLLHDVGSVATQVKVVTERSVVYLMGILTPAEAEQVTEITRRVGGVERVIKLFEYTE